MRTPSAPSSSATTRCSAGGDRSTLELSFLECPAFAATVLHALWSGHEIAINGFANLSGLFMAYFAARFGVLGAYVAGRSREKQAAVTGQSVPSIAAEVVKAMRRGRRG